VKSKALKVNQIQEALSGEGAGPTNPAERNVSTTFIQFARLNAWPDLPLRPGSYVAFLPCRIQFNELNSTEIRRLNRLPYFCRTFDWSCRVIREKCDTDSDVEFLPCRI